MQKCDIFVDVYLSKEEAKRLDELARKNGMTRSGYLRALIRNEPPKQLSVEEYEILIDELRDMDKEIKHLNAELPQLNSEECELKVQNVCDAISVLMQQITDAVTDPDGFDADE